MKIAVFHNVPPGGATRAVFEEVKYLKTSHIVDFFRYSSTEDRFLDVGKIAENVRRYDFDLISNLPGFLNRLNVDLQNFYKLRKVAKIIAQDINAGGYDVALIHPDKFTQAPFILRYLEIPTVYFCEEYLRLVYEDQFEFKKTGNSLKNN